MRYHDRQHATAYLREQRGVTIGDSTLEYLAARGRGPRYVIVNGRALYTANDLDAWIAEQAAQPPKRKRRAEAA